MNPKEQKSRPNDQHVYHHNDNDGPRIYVKVERNSKGFNYEVSVSDTKTVEEAMALLSDARQKLETSLEKPPEQQ